MKTIKELDDIRREVFRRVNQGKDRDSSRITVGLATCGISAGAKPVLNAAREEVEKLSLTNLSVEPTGCIGVCRLEPIVEVIKPGEEKVTYVKMTPEKIKKVIKLHLVEGKVVTEYTMHNVDGKILNDYSVIE